MLFGTAGSTIAEAMGVQTRALSAHEAGLAAAAAVARLCQQLGLPTRLRDVDVPEAGLERIAMATLPDRALATNAKPFTMPHPFSRPYGRPGACLPW
ncbi:MAG: iron-containing alcohol dehydrogenase [Candidatus Tectimicrobiota bacterium]